MSELNRKAASGIAWTIGRVALQITVGLGVGVVLARLLPVADFGVMAIAMAFANLAEVLSSAGMGAAIVQHKTIRQAHVDTAISWSILIGLLLLLIFWLLAPWASLWYGDERLTDVLRCIAVSQFSASLGAVPRGLLRRHMRFKLLFKIDFLSYALGYAVVAIALALSGLGVWSLALATLVWMLLTTLWSWQAAGVRWQPALDRDVSRELLGFGVGLSVKGLIFSATTAVDSLVIGRFLGSPAVGLYQRANQLASLPLARLGSTISHVMFPVYSLIQDEPEKLRRHYLEALHTIGMLCLPIQAALGAVPEVVIVGLYGEKWRAAAPLLRLLALAGVINTLHHLAGALVEAKGHIREELWRQTVYLLLLVAGMLLAAPYGLEAVAWVLVACTVWLYASMNTLALRLIGARWGDFLRAQLVGLSFGLFVALGAWLAGWFASERLGLSATLALLLVICVCAVLYLGGLWWIPGAHQQLFGRRVRGER